MNFILAVKGVMVSLILGLVVTFGLGAHTVQINKNLGNFGPTQAQKFTLAGSGITAAASSVQLASFKLPDAATKITMAVMNSNIGFGTLEPGTSKEEQISFTGITQNADGSATLTGVNRGLAFTSPFAASTTLAYSHAGAGVFVLSNTAAFYNQFAIKQNNETITGIYTFSSTSAPVYDFNPNFGGASSTTIPSKGYVDGVAVAGCSNADEFTKGCVELATGVEAASSTSAGSTGARLVLSSVYATSSPGLNATATVVMSQIDGKIAQGFLRLSDAFNFTGTLAVGSSTPTIGNRFAVQGNEIISGTSTMSNLVVASSTVQINTVTYKFPSSILASSTILTTNATGDLRWIGPDWEELTATSSVVATSTINLNGLSARTDYRLIVETQGMGSAQSLFIRLNEDKSNYGSYSVEDCGLTTAVGNDIGVALHSATTAAAYFDINISNQSGFRKQLSWTGHIGGTGSQPGCPIRGGGVWNNTTSTISQIWFNNGPGGSISANARVKLYGSRN